ncbi:uracil-DNA glycosylase [Candidatus Bathyarchaeota archaeon ex4484_231]|nr:MAG: uracil-DNA glycosylase [Candidatus Bathyarchaeota archaeon ex4484_231]RJS74496.1 MAG: uracil-DNA glycosylase [Candidatus Bathyarchaeota archaeon]
MKETSKQQQLEAIAEEIRKCTKCNLAKTRSKAVPGEGNPDSQVVFIGEAPGYWENVKGKPFVGAAGKILDEVLGKIGISRSEVFITNVLKCRPPMNRDPRKAEVEACIPYLDRQLEVMKPRFIVTLGRHSSAYIFSKIGKPFSSISKVRGKLHVVNLWGSTVYVQPTFHPAAALYNVELKRDLEADLRLLKHELDRLQKRS